MKKFILLLLSGFWFAPNLCAHNRGARRPLFVNPASQILATSFQEMVSGPEFKEAAVQLPFLGKLRHLSEGDVQMDKAYRWLLGAVLLSNSEWGYPGLERDPSAEKELALAQRFSEASSEVRQAWAKAFEDFPEGVDAVIAERILETQKDLQRKIEIDSENVLLLMQMKELDEFLLLVEALFPSEIIKEAVAAFGEFRSNDLSRRARRSFSDTVEDAPIELTPGEENEAREMAASAERIDLRRLETRQAKVALDRSIRFSATDGRRHYIYKGRTNRPLWRIGHPLEAVPEGFYIVEEGRLLASSLNILPAGGVGNLIKGLDRTETEGGVLFSFSDPGGHRFFLHFSNEGQVPRLRVDSSKALSASPLWAPGSPLEIMSKELAQEALVEGLSIEERHSVPSVLPGKVSEQPLIEKFKANSLVGAIFSNLAFVVFLYHLATEGMKGFSNEPVAYAVGISLAGLALSLSAARVMAGSRNGGKLNPFVLALPMWLSTMLSAGMFLSSGETEILIVGSLVFLLMFWGTWGLYQRFSQVWRIKKGY